MRKYIVLFLVAALAITAGFDGYLIYLGGGEASISHYIIEIAYAYPVVTFLVGFLMGHLFWRLRDTKKTIEISSETQN